MDTFEENSLCLIILVLQELSSVNYLELYRVADLFHLPALEQAVVGYLVEHLSELSQGRQDEALQLPFRLLREVLKSDRLTSLSEEEIWKVCSEMFFFCVDEDTRCQQTAADKKKVLSDGVKRSFCCETCSG